MSVEITNLHIEYPEKLVFNDVNLSVADNEIVAIETQVLDGGTSLLKGIAGFLSGVAGQVILDGVDLLDSPSAASYYRVGFVYEEQGLLSVYDVEQNINLPLQYHTTLSPAEIRSEVESVLDLLGISHTQLCLKPHELNDVQTRMINLARALVTRPGLLLIDELEGGMPEDYLATTMTRLRERQKQFPMAIITTTASELVLAQADRIYEIEHCGLVPAYR